MAEYSVMHCDLLDCIFVRLASVDLSRCALTCRHWSAAAMRVLRRRRADYDAFRGPLLRGKVASRRLCRISPAATKETFELNISATDGERVFVLMEPAQLIVIDLNTWEIEHRVDLSKFKPSFKSLPGKSLCVTNKFLLVQVGGEVHVVCKGSLQCVPQDFECDGKSILLLRNEWSGGRIHRRVFAHHHEESEKWPDPVGDLPDDCVPNGDNLLEYSRGPFLEFDGGTGQFRELPCAARELKVIHASAVSEGGFLLVQSTDGKLALVDLRLSQIRWTARAERVDPSDEFFLQWKFSLNLLLSRDHAARVCWLPESRLNVDVWRLRDGRPHFRHRLRWQSYHDCRPFRLSCLGNSSGGGGGGGGGGAVLAFGVAFTDGHVARVALVDVAGARLLGQEYLSKADEDDELLLRYDLLMHFNRESGKMEVYDLSDLLSRKQIEEEDDDYDVSDDVLGLSQRTVCVKSFDESPISVSVIRPVFPTKRTFIAEDVMGLVLCELQISPD